MKIFKELKRLGYIHYSATTIEELDDLPLNSAERVSEQALVLRWFREKYGLCSWITMELGNKSTFCWVLSGEHTLTQYAAYFYTYEEAELACLIKLIEIVKTYDTFIQSIQQPKMPIGFECVCSCSQCEARKQGFSLNTNCKKQYTTTNSQGII